MTYCLANFELFLVGKTEAHFCQENNSFKLQLSFSTELSEKKRENIWEYISCAQNKIAHLI